MKKIKNNIKQNLFGTKNILLPVLIFFVLIISQDSPAQNYISYHHDYRGIKSSSKNFNTGNNHIQKLVSVEETEKIDSLLSLMTLQEKIGQLVQIVGAGNTHDGMIEKGLVGSFLLGTRGYKFADSLQRIAVNQSRLHIPLIFANDVIHGYKTIFPIPLANSCSWDTALISKAARIAALEAGSEGTNWTYSPMVDIARDPRWGRIMEGAGEDPYLGSAIAAAVVRGYQGNDLTAPGTIAACAKHFVAYGAAEAGRDYNTVDISERTLREIYLPPFNAAVEAGAESIMSAFNDLNGIPATANHFTLTDVLRNEWHFKGVVISDYNSIPELINHGIAKDKSEAALKALTAGVDIDMVGGSPEGNAYLPNLKNIVVKGLLSEKLIDRSVRRVLKMKFDLGLFNHPYVDTAFYSEHMPSINEKNKIALQLARESIVLLNNENKLLPIKKNIASIAVIGPLADDAKNPLGVWSSAGWNNNAITILNGIKDKVSGNTKVYYCKGSDINNDNTEGFKEAIGLAKISDVAVLVVGESREMSGEASSKTNLNLPGEQEELVKAIYKTGTPVIVVLMNGRPLTINWISKYIPAVVESWFPGDQAGNAVADVLFGDYNPSGKLTVTFPRSVGQVPIFYNHMNTGRPPTDEKYTSKYIDSPVTPLYPFGYGLSFTKFRYSDIKVEHNKIHKNDFLNVTVKIKNIGNLTGTEIAELYLHDRVASVTRPVKELKGFQRVTLKPSEEKVLHFIITPDDLSFYNISMNKVIEPGIFDVMIGGSSDDVISASFEVVK